MRIESLFSISYLIGSTPMGVTEVHRKEVDQQGRAYHTVTEYPFFSYSASGSLESLKEVGKNVDKLA